MPVTNDDAAPWMPYEPALPNGSPATGMRGIAESTECSALAVGLRAYV